MREQSPGSVFTGSMIDLMVKLELKPGSLRLQSLRWQPLNCPCGMLTFPSPGVLFVQILKISKGPVAALCSTNPEGMKNKDSRSSQFLWLHQMQANIKKIWLAKTPFREKMPSVKLTSKICMANICRWHSFYLIKSTLEKSRVERTALSKVISERFIRTRDIHTLLFCAIRFSHVTREKNKRKIQATCLPSPNTFTCSHRKWNDNGSHDLG